MEKLGILKQMNHAEIHEVNKNHCQVDPMNPARMINLDSDEDDEFGM